jgi:RNA 3'-terminal phosphate cyclase
MFTKATIVESKCSLRNPSPPANYKNFPRSPGYALTLLAESTTSAIYCAEAISEAGIAPEEIGLKATRALLSEIEKGGCVDQRHQTLVLLMMVLGSEDVGRCRMGEPTLKTSGAFNKNSILLLSNEM